MSLESSWLMAARHSKLGCFGGTIILQPEVCPITGEPEQPVTNYQAFLNIYLRNLANKSKHFCGAWSIRLEKMRRFTMDHLLGSRVPVHVNLSLLARPTPHSPVLWPIWTLHEVHVIHWLPQIQLTSDYHSQPSARALRALINHVYCTAGLLLTSDVQILCWRPAH